MVANKSEKIFTIAAIIGITLVILMYLCGRMTPTTIVSSVLYRGEADGVKESAFEVGDAPIAANDVDLNCSIYNANPEQYQEGRQLYLDRMTYGFEQTAEAGQEAHVANGSEVLLETLLPYMSDEERRLVLQTTAIDSG